MEFQEKERMEVECISTIKKKKKTRRRPKKKQKTSTSRRASPPSAVAVKVRAAAAENSNDQTKKNKTVLITGANTGIGLVAAKTLASRGYDVVLGCRDPAKAKAALAAVRAAAAPGASVSLPNGDSSLLDLSSLASIKDFSAAVLDSGKALHVLLNNAGVMALPTREATKDGFEYQLGVNHVGHAALTWRLMPLLLETATADEKREGTEGGAVRVVTVASSAHQFGRVDFADLNRERSYSAWDAYGQSKLANILFAYELARRTALAPGSTRFTSNALHPGVVKTELARYLFGEPRLSFFFVVVVFRAQTLSLCLSRLSLSFLAFLTAFLFFFPPPPKQQQRQQITSNNRPGHRGAPRKARGPRLQPLSEDAGAGGTDEHLPEQLRRRRGRLWEILRRFSPAGLQPGFL